MLQKPHARLKLPGRTEFLHEFCPAKNAFKFIHFNQRIIKLRNIYCGHEFQASRIFCGCHGVFTPSQVQIEEFSHCFEGQYLISWIAGEKVSALQSE
jgi:hypothetical protein